MAGTYFMGARSFTSKAGKALATASFLTKGNFGWNIVQKWIHPEQLEMFKGVSVGSAVICNLDMSGNIVDIAVNESLPELLLDDDSI